MDVQMLVCRKNEVVRELDFVVEVLAAAFGAELDFARLRKMSLVFVLMLKAMRARLCRHAEAARQVMLFGAIVKPHVPTHRDKKHHKGHQ